MTDFEGWLRKGLGRAAVFLRANDSAPWREQLLYVCTHYLTYDAQCEESRAHYLLDLIEISGEADFYRNRIIAVLSGDHEEMDLGQMFEVVSSFAANGSDAAKQAMYTAFHRHGFDAAGLTCAEQLVILDGLRGLLFAMKSFREVEPDERPWQFGYLIEVLKKHHGEQTLPSELDRFVKEWQEQERPGSRNDRRGQSHVWTTARSSAESRRRDATSA